MHKRHRELGVARRENAHLREEVSVRSGEFMPCFPFAAHLLEDAFRSDVLLFFFVFVLYLD